MKRIWYDNTATGNRFNMVLPLTSLINGHFNTMYSFSLSNSSISFPLCNSALSTHGKALYKYLLLLLSGDI